MRDTATPLRTGTQRGSTRDGEPLSAKTPSRAGRGRGCHRGEIVFPSLSAKTVHCVQSNKTQIVSSEIVNGSDTPFKSANSSHKNANGLCRSSRCRSTTIYGRESSLRSKNGRGSKENGITRGEKGIRCPAASLLDNTNHWDEHTAAARDLRAKVLRYGGVGADPSARRPSRTGEIPNASLQRFDPSRPDPD
ncbi:hypothetical protein K469DRAFT_311228 [Zopfia rhizophila CBS 207.26]|uniref:Uncharacterized protein n=1 Tax=Zopfia rhizophila CBS 207.26 TaxID=1314779 RepID=A0A6A6EMX4_9PEZI|nr:hypothetical protein K469DRAFT_311228 [Zopfia rhizophila CBS 207.26]